MRHRERLPAIVLRAAEVCDLACLPGPKVLKELVARGEFPPPFKIGDNERWRPQDIKRFLRAKAAMSYGLEFDPKKATVKVCPSFDADNFPEELAEIHSSLLEYSMFSRLPCIYFLINFWQIVYVGQSQCLPLRVAQHQRGTKTEPKKEFNRVLYLPVDGPKLTEAERYFINLLDPVLNKAGRVSQ